MDQVLQPQLDLENVGPEVKSYIYQVLTEFEPFVTPETTLAVIARDPKALGPEDDFQGDFPESLDQRSKMYRICIRMVESGTSIEAEGLGTDIYSALRLAKDSLMKTLTEIHDRVVDTQERHLQIQSALNSSGVH